MGLLCVCLVAIPGCKILPHPYNETYISGIYDAKENPGNCVVCCSLLSRIIAGVPFLYHSQSSFLFYIQCLKILAILSEMSREKCVYAILSELEVPFLFVWIWLSFFHNINIMLSFHGYIVFFFFRLLILALLKFSSIPHIFYFLLLFFSYPVCLFWSLVCQKFFLNVWQSLGAFHAYLE